MSAFNSVLKIADENLDNIYNCMAIEENKRDIFCFNNDRYYSWLEQKERKA